ncbi:M20 family metallopeptidase [Sporolactobacillus putidus]|uniref:Succinyl-diaminopimelate desuccinylase n=1 Tax=Sporolactobacillus putidus TaxID=492735 RepID=A0A917W1A9_9BACL|nr:M20 family metallopeptidase [Sporolactobacillus putidus]GGL56956.1 succinyl-diaminopimelate desuccinylase [Sporolactobacillus putidus]
MSIEDIYRLIDEDDAVLFLKSLIRLNSVNPPGSEKKVAELIKERSEKAGLKASLFTFEPGRSNLFVEGASNRTEKENRNLVLSGHLDTVPIGNGKWEHDPWSADQDGDRLYGRGSSDMKSGAAAMILALETIQKSGVRLKGNLSFLGTAGEEVDGRGARSVLREGIIKNATAMVIGEPTNNELLIAHKGVLWLEIIINGKTAHAGWPENGVNAISAMHVFVQKLGEIDLPNHEILGKSTLNLGLINGGTAPNMVADRCQLTIDIRMVPGQERDGILHQVKTILAAISDPMGITYKVNVLNNMLPVSTSREDPFIKVSADTLQEVLDKKPIFGGANYYSDGSIFTTENKNIPILIFGPGNPVMAHQPNEWVDLRNFIDSIRYYIALAVHYLGA